VSTTRARTYELDLLRLVAALSVVIYHYTWHAWAIEKTSPVAYPRALTTVTRYGFLGVHLFFLISGMVILASVVGRTPRQFAASRASRLFPAYWALVTFTFVVTHVLGAQRLTVGPIDWLVNLTMLQQFAPNHLHRVAMVDNVYWTLTLELIFYAVVWSVMRLKQLHHMELVLGAWLAMSAVVEVGGVGPLDTMRRYAGVEYAALFVVGAACALVRADRRRLAPWLLLVAGTPLAIRQSVLSVREADLARVGSYHAWVGGAFAAAAIAVVVVIALGGLRRIGRPWMTTAGLLTYPLYLVHQNVGLSIYEKVHLERWVLLAAVLGGVLLVSWLTTSFIERPLAPWLRRGLSGRERVHPEIEVRQPAPRLV
jgi:peptidoglycan/LPS O-acetylase OafA/YrhL